MNRVNSVISILFALAITVGFFMGKIDDSTFMGIAGMAIVFFYPKNKDA